MARQSCVLPCNLIGVFPKLNFPVIRSWSDKVLARMEAYPVGAPFMPLQNLNTFDFYSYKGWEVFGFCQFFFQYGIVPDSDSRIKGSAYDEIFLWMELGAHDIVAVACDYIDTGSTLVVPETHGLVVACGQNPWELIMEKSRSNIIDMAFQSEQAAFLFVVPYFYVAIIAAWYEEWQLGVEVYATHSSIVLLLLDPKLLRTWQGWFWGYSPIIR